jgi:tRNA(Ile)-lysidine synthase
MKKKSLNVQKKIHSLLLNNLRDKRILNIYNRFKNNTFPYLGRAKHIGVALSGGPDSLALVYLAKCLSIEKKIKVSFFTVDHKLRKESESEVKKIQILLKKFDISCQVLEWTTKKPKSNIQSIARKNRYNLILNTCEKKKINHLLLGHHVDDLYENFFIRLLRGSGLKGLTSFDLVSRTANKKISILRPLINSEKKELIYISKKIFKFYVQDPSNENIIFQRTRVRSLISNFKKEGLDKNKLNLTIRNLKSSIETIDFYVEKNIYSNSIYIKNKNTFVLKQDFFEQSREVIFRSFIIILRSISKRYYSPRGKSIIRIILKIQTNKLSKVTLGGCFIEKINKTILITKEN